MCGVFGFVGKSSNQKVTDDFITVLSDKTRCQNGNLFLSISDKITIGQCRLPTAGHPYVKDEQVLVYDGGPLDFDVPTPPTYLNAIPDIVKRVIFFARSGIAKSEGCLWLIDGQTGHKDSPFHVVDMRREIGQIFFFSTAEIWRDAINSAPSIKPYIPKEQMIIVFPIGQVWKLKPPTDDWGVTKYKIDEKPL